MADGTLDVAAAAAALAEARRAGRLIDVLAPHLTPRSIVDGYRIQDQFMAQWPDRLVGWKVGATAKPVQVRFGINEPFSGPFFAGDVSASPAQLPAAKFAHGLIESEFAFRFARAIAPSQAPIARDVITAAIDAVLPAIEIVGPRFREIPFGQAPVAVADCGLNEAIILGAPVLNWQRLDLAAHPVRLTVNGNEKGAGRGGDVLGHPLNVLDWLVNHLSQRGITLQAGAVVLTGTTTGVVPLRTGDTAIADFGNLGRIELAMHGAPHLHHVAAAI